MSSGSGAGSVMSTWVSLFASVALFSRSFKRADKPSRTLSKVLFSSTVFCKFEKHIKYFASNSGKENVYRDSMLCIVENDVKLGHI